MSAWLEKRPSGYLLVWRNAEGSRSSKSYPSKIEAGLALAEFKARLPSRPRRRVGGPQPMEALTIEALAARWLDAKRATERAASAEEARRRAVATAQALGWRYSRDATAESVHRFLVVTEGRRRRDLAYLRGILRWGADHHHLALDRAADVAMRPGAGSEAPVDLLTDAQWAAIRERAYDLGQGLLVDCLATYGWRPITACRITCGDVRADGTVALAVKRRTRPWTHPLFPLHRVALRELAAGRPATEPLFLTAMGNPWPLHAGKAARLSAWYSQQLRRFAPEAGNIYALKRMALTRMDEGRRPWVRRLSLTEIQLFSGHKDPKQVLTYLRTNQRQALHAMGSELPTECPLDLE